MSNYRNTIVCIREIISSNGFFSFFLGDRDNQYLQVPTEQYGENKFLKLHGHIILPPVFFHPRSQRFLGLLEDPLREEIMCITVQKIFNAVFRDTCLERDNWKEVQALCEAKVQQPIHVSRNLIEHG